LTFAVAKAFVNIFSTKYYLANYLEIILAEAKFGTLCCASEFCDAFDCDNIRLSCVFFGLK